MAPPIFRSLANTCIGLIACAGSVPLYAENNGIKVDLHAHAEVRHMQVTLGDVASLSGDDADMLSEWREIPLGIAPRPGRPVRLERHRLQRWVRAYLASGQRPAQWSGAESIEVTAASRKLPGSEVAARAQAALQDWLRTRVSHLEIAQIGELRDLSIPDGLLRLTVRPIGGGAKPERRMQLWVEVWMDEVFIRAIPVEFSVRAYQTGYVARQDAAAGSVVHATDFERKEIDLADPAKQDAVAVRADASAWRLKRGLRQGSALLQTQIQPVPAVMRGQSATLRSRNGVVELESKVEVLQDGFTGQMVKVRPTSASESILARVAGAGLLEMTER